MDDYKFYNYNNNETRSIDISDLGHGDIFYAYDNDGRLICDDNGNSLFEAVSEVQSGVCGRFINCIPRGSVIDANRKRSK